MTRTEAKKRLLGFLINQLDTDDCAPFGEEIAEQGSGTQAYDAFNAAREELIKEFTRRGAT